MKKLIAMLLVLVSVLACFVACGGDDKKEETKEEEEITVDYTDIAKFKADLEAGEAMAGKTLTFKVEEIEETLYGNMVICSDLRFDITGGKVFEVGDELTVTVMNTRMALNVRYIECTLAE